MNSDERLMAQVGKHITGLDVEVRLRTPTADNAVGQLYRTKYGALIDVEPRLDEDAILSVLLHEIAHLKNGDLTYLPITYEYLAPSGSKVRTKAVRNEWRASAPEAAADDLAGKWLDYASKHYHLVDRDGFTAFGKKLLCLLNMEV